MDAPPESNYSWISTAPLTRGDPVSYQKARLAQGGSWRDGEQGARLPQFNPERLWPLSSGQARREAPR
jgi:hypothetical protein